MSAASTPASALGRAAMMARLARWLGPWTAEHRRPDISRRSVRLDEGFDLWVYRPRERPARGATLVVPGLHYLGPADVRLDRFNSILADSGQVVVCPFLPEFRRTLVGRTLVEHTLAAYDAMSTLEEVPPGRPGVFSISFGSFPAIRVAADRDPGALVLFGGYASFTDTIRFSIEGAPGHPHDPLNQPVVFLNLIDHLEDLPKDRSPLARAWTTYLRRTWGKEDMKRGAWRPLAARMSGRLPVELREMFEIGVGLRPEGVAVISRALDRAGAAFDHLDPLPYCKDVCCPVTIVHGRDDDVIPHTQAELLHAALPGSRALLTGLYAHTGSSAVAPRAAIEEGKAMIGILSAITDAALRGYLPNGRQLSTER